MAESYRFFDAVASDRQYTSADFAAVLVRFLRDGYIPGVGNELAVSATSPATMAVNVAAGEAMLQGRWYKNDAAKTINIATADSSNPRIDRIVLKLDLNPAARSITAVVKTGTATASPTAPALTQTTTVWELPLARVFVGAGVGTIAADKITDERGSLAMPPYLYDFIENIFKAHKDRHKTGGADAITPADIGAVKSPGVGTAGYVLKSGGENDPYWGEVQGGGGGGYSVSCPSQDLSPHGWVELLRMTVPEEKTFIALASSIYPYGMSGLVISVENLTDDTTPYSSDLAWNDGTLCTVVAGKELAVRVKNTSSSEVAAIKGFLSFIVS